MREVDEHALRLDAALAFDEVRSLATMEERHRLAREIHDGVAQEIASLGYVVDDLTATRPPRRAAQEAQRAARGALPSRQRAAAVDLRPAQRDLGRPGSALSDYVREVGARSGMTVHLTLDEAPTRLRGEVETELLRIAQEAITNARKHSAATNLWVDCRIRPPYAAHHRVATTATAWARPATTPTASRSCASAPTGSAPRSRSPTQSRDRAAHPGHSVTVTVGAEAPALA